MGPGTLSGPLDSSLLLPDPWLGSDIDLAFLLLPTASMCRDHLIRGNKGVFSCYFEKNDRRNNAHCPHIPEDVYVLILETVNMSGYVAQEKGDCSWN